MNTSPEPGVGNSARVRRLTLGLGILQLILGVALTVLSFITFFITDLDRLRNSCPYWAGIIVCLSGAVGISAWKRSSTLWMGIFTLISTACVILQMIGTIFAADVGSVLNSVTSCSFEEPDICLCCDYPQCEQDSQGLRFEGLTDCAIIQGILKELVYSLFVLNIFGSLLCCTASVFGCTALAHCLGRDQIRFRRHNFERSTTVTEDSASCQTYPRDLDVVLPYAPPMYRSAEHLQEYGTTHYIVPPPVFDPTDLPPPYSTRNPTFFNSSCSVGCRDCTVCQCNRQKNSSGCLSTHRSCGRLPAQERELKAQVSLLNNCSRSCNTSVCTPLQQGNGARKELANMENHTVPHSRSKVAANNFSGSGGKSMTCREASRDCICPGPSEEAQSSATVEAATACLPSYRETVV